MDFFFLREKWCKAKINFSDSSVAFVHKAIGAVIAFRI